MTWRRLLRYYHPGNLGLPKKNRPRAGRAQGEAGGGRISTGACERGVGRGDCLGSSCPGAGSMRAARRARDLAMTQPQPKDLRTGPQAESLAPRLEMPDAPDELELTWPLSVRLLFILSAALAISAITILLVFLIID
jgi:hypothetical protein